MTLGFVAFTQLRHDTLDEVVAGLHVDEHVTGARSFLLMEATIPVNSLKTFTLILSAATSFF